MEPVTWGVVGAVAGAVVGAASSICTTLITTNNIRKIKRDEKLFDKQEQAREAQLNNYLELQESLTELVNLTVEGLLYLSKEYLKKNKSNVLLSDDLNLKLHNMNRKTILLIARVQDDSLRSDVKDFKRKVSPLLLAASYEECQSNMSKFLPDLEKVIDAIGVQLRANQ